MNSTESSDADPAPRPRPRPTPRPADTPPEQTAPAVEPAAGVEPATGVEPVSGVEPATTAEPEVAAEDLAATEHDPARGLTLRAEIAGLGRPAELAPVGVRSPWWLAIVLTVLVAAAAAAAVVFATLHPKDTGASAREAAVNAAKQYVADVISYDYRKLDDNIATTSPHLTGSFKDDYLRSMNQVIKPGAAQQKAVVEGTVDTAALETVSPDGKQITVLVIGLQKVTNVSTTTPRSDPVRLRVTLDRVGKTWKISKLDAL